MFLQFKKN